MSVIPVTVFFSLGLAIFFVVLFLREQQRRVFASAERDSLLPLADEQARVVGQDAPLPSGLAKDDPSPDDRSPCGCPAGNRAICSHCQARPGQIL